MFIDTLLSIKWLQISLKKKQTGNDIIVISRNRLILQHFLFGLQNHGNYMAMTACELLSFPHALFVIANRASQRASGHPSTCLPPGGPPLESILKVQTVLVRARQNRENSFWSTGKLTSQGRLFFDPENSVCFCPTKSATKAS